MARFHDFKFRQDGNKTIIELDGKQVKCRGFRLEVSAFDIPKLSIDLLADSLEIETGCEIES